MKFFASDLGKCEALGSGREDIVRNFLYLGGWIPFGKRPLYQCLKSLKCQNFANLRSFTLKSFALAGGGACFCCIPIRKKPNLSGVEHSFGQLSFRDFLTLSNFLHICLVVLKSGKFFRFVAMSPICDCGTCELGNALLLSLDECLRCHYAISKCAFLDEKRCEQNLSIKK